MPSKKTTTEPAATETDAAPDQAAEAPLQMPATGGSWIRQLDGSLVRDPAEHPQNPADAPQA